MHVIQQLELSPFLPTQKARKATVDEREILPECRFSATEPIKFCTLKRIRTTSTSWDPPPLFPTHSMYGSSRTQEGSHTLWIPCVTISVRDSGLPCMNCIMIL